MRKSTSVSSWATSRSYYGADEKLRMYRRISSAPVGSRADVVDEYRYDALGRRVLLRSNHGSNCDVGVGLQAGWNILRAGAGTARNLPQAGNVTEQVAFKSLLSGPARTIAGPGSRATFDDAGRIASTYGGRAGDWAKMPSATKWTDRMGRQFETH